MPVAEPANPVEAALLAAIRADPTDEAARLVYTDHLLERGDPRAEVLQLQRRQRDTGDPPGPWERHLLAERLRPLIALRDPTGVFEPSPLVTSELAFPTLPLQLRLRAARDWPDHASRLARHRDAASVYTLDLSQLDDIPDALLDGDVQPRRLVVPMRWSFPRVRQMQTAALCRRVEHLDLSGAIDSEALATLLESPWIGQLRSLVVGMGATYPVETPLGPYGAMDAATTDAGIAAIASASARLTSLRHLDLRYAMATAASMRALAASTLQLESLLVSVDTLGATGIAELAASRLAPITRLSVGICTRPDPATYRALVESPLWAGRSLDLVSEYDAFDAIVEALAAAAPTRPLHELRVSGRDTRAASLAKLWASPIARELRHLALGHPIKGAGCRALADAKLPLESLCLDRCDIGPSGIAALVEAPSMQRLRHLYLHDCRIQETGVRKLAKSALRPERISLRDFCDPRSYLAFLASPLLERATDIHVDLQIRTVDSHAATKTLLETPYLATARSISLPDLNHLPDERKAALAERFGAALVTPRTYGKVCR